MVFPTRVAGSALLFAQSLLHLAFALPSHAEHEARAIHDARAALYDQPLARQLEPSQGINNSTNSSVPTSSTLSGFSSTSLGLSTGISSSSLPSNSEGVTSDSPSSNTETITSDSPSSSLTITSDNAASTAPSITSEIPTSTTPRITSFTSTSGAPLPTVPYGITTTVISDTTYTLTYISTTVTDETTIVESDASTTTTATYTDGAPIWVVPTLPPGYPGPAPGPPPIGPPAPNGGGGGGSSGCIFGCGGGGGGGGGGDPDDPNDPDDPEDPDDPTSTKESQSTTSAPSSVSSSASSSSSSSSSSGLYCEVGCSICNLRRYASPTAAPEKPKRHIPNLLEYAAGSLQERNIPGENSEVIADTYDEVKTSGNTLTVELADGPVPGSTVARQGVSSSQFTDFDEAEHNIFVQGLEGCTSVLVVSRAGAWASHLWERPSFTSDDAKFQADVLDYLNSELDAHAATFADRSKTKAFIMTPAPEEFDLHGSGDAANGNNPLKYSTRVQDIQDLLNEKLSGATIEEPFVYAVQRGEAALRSGPYGKAMILYSNNQEFDPEDVLTDWDPHRHVYQVWTQGKLIGKDDWIPCQRTGSKRQDSCPIDPSSAASSTAVSTAPDETSGTANATPSEASSILDSTLATSTIPNSLATPTPSSPAISTSPSSSPISSATPEPVPSSTSEPAPKPTDFNCDCGESSCSPDSMPCCANGSCECHCDENGCADEDPTCCANGSCAPLRKLLRFM